MDSLHNTIDVQDLIIGTKEGPTLMDYRYFHTAIDNIDILSDNTERRWRDGQRHVDSRQT